MLIRELLEDISSEDDLSSDLSAAINLIAGRVIDTNAQKPMSLTSIVNILNNMGMNYSEEQIRDMYTKPPLNSTIANIEGDNVTFLGQRKETSNAVKPDQSTATLEKMAKRAEKKRQ
jgi:hypothetical protein